MLQRVKSPSTLAIAGVDRIYVGPGLGRKEGNARTGAEEDGMQYKQFSDVAARAGRM